MEAETRTVVVTTEFRGVFFGTVVSDAELPAKITLKDARACVYWSNETKGVLGLAAKGPSKQSRIGPKIPTADLWKITGVFECTPEAIEAWEKEPWS